MKQKMIKGLCAVALMGLLAGCGSDKKDADAVMYDDPLAGVLDEQELTNKNKETIAVSEYFGAGKRIMYRTDSGTLDKADKPDSLYFFEDGTIRTVGGNDFGLTLGELSQMSDEEIWGKLDEYNTGKYENALAGLQQMENGENMLEIAEHCAKAEYSESEVETFAEDIAEGLYKWGSYSIEFAAEKPSETDPEEWEKKVEETKAKLIEAVKKELEEKEAAAPIAFILETDASGNSVKDEVIAYPDGGTGFEEIVLYYYLLDSPIYESSYAVYQGNEIFYCVRDDAKIALDEIDSENVYLDVPLSADKLEELFQ